MPPDPTSPATCTVHDRAHTAQLLDYPALVDAIAAAAAELADGRIVSPGRLVVPLVHGGVLLSMPAAAADIAVHKLVTVQPGNRMLGLPTIHGTVTVCDAATGQPLLALDGPELTGRRTAAVTLAALRHLLGAAPAEVLLIGTGVQAAHHVQALQAVYPAARIWIRGTSADRADAFCRSAAASPRLCPVAPGSVPAGVAAVITLTTSTEPVYNEAPVTGRVVIGVGAFKPGMAELGAATLHGSDLYADDPSAAQHEAGDLMRAHVHWPSVRSLAALLAGPVDQRRPVVFKSVGTAAWDLAAARVALARRRNAKSQP